MTKVMSFSDAVESYVRPGMLLHFSLTGSRPNAAIRELARQYRGRDPQFVVSSTSVGGMQLGLFLLEERLVRKVITAFLGDGYPVPSPSPLAQELVASGELEVEEWSLLSFNTRLRAAAQGLPWLPGSTLLHSDIQSNLVRLADEESGQHVVKLPALVPDLTFVHGAVSDELGNTVLTAPYGESALGALAASGGALVTTERIVSREEFRRFATLPSIPAAVVRSVSLVPFGAHPSGVYAPLVDPPVSYADDYAFMADATRAMRSDTSERRRWHDEWIAVDSSEYVAKVGGARLNTLIARSAYGSIGERERTRHEGPRTGEVGRGAPIPERVHPTEGELLVANAVEILGEVFAPEQHDMVLAGVGISSIAAWVADRMGRISGCQFISELGFVDYEPEEGNPFVFSYWNLPMTQMLSDIDMVLGSLVQTHGSRTLAVLAAGQVDSQGCINTSWLRNGKWLTGSGGACDIASSVDDVLVVVPHAPSRLRSKVDYVTSPGRNVRWVVTDRAVFKMHERDDPELWRVRSGDEPDLERVVADLRELTPWDFTLSEDIGAMAPPSHLLLDWVARFDPDEFLVDQGRQ